MNWIDSRDDIDRAKRLRAVFDRNTSLDAGDRRLLVRALGDFIASYHAGRQVISQAEEPAQNRAFSRLGEAVRGL
jgi:hypothetical protein